MKRWLIVVFALSLTVGVWAGAVYSKQIERAVRPVACLVQEWQYPGSRCDVGRAAPGMQPAPLAE